MRQNPVSPALGVEVHGVDARTRPDETTLRALRFALDEHQLLLLRGQSLDAGEQAALLECFGPPLVENDSGQRHQYVSNTREGGILGGGRFAFHSDHAFMPDPIDVISLFGLEIPPGCGRTRFANALRAARSLPAGLRERVATLRARHAIDPAAEPDVVAIRRGPPDPALPHAFHPVLWEHPRLGKPVLYVSEQQTDSVEGLDPAAGRELLEELFAHLYAPAHVYVHEWCPGDLLVWDNRALQHARDAIGNEVARTLRRVAVGGTSVIEFFRSHEQWQLG